MKRKEFIRNTAVGTSGLILTPYVFSQNNSLFKKKRKITILHTNDTHSNIDAFPDNHAKYPGLGGISKRYSLIQKIREEEENVLLLDAGDIFQGTPYFNTFKGVLEMKLMSQLQYDASTMGNHDFDAGLEGFYKAKKYANFVTNRNGGNRAVAEACLHIMKKFFTRYNPEKKLNKNIKFSGKWINQSPLTLAY